MDPLVYGSRNSFCKTRPKGSVRDGDVRELFLWGDRGREMQEIMCESDEEWAIRIMWTLEDEVHHPWQVLRTFVESRSSSSMEHLVRSMTDQFVEAKRLFKTHLCWHCHDISCGGENSQSRNHRQGIAWRQERGRQAATPLGTARGRGYGRVCATRR